MKRLGLRLLFLIFLIFLLLPLLLALSSLLFCLIYLALLFALGLSFDRSSHLSIWSAERRYGRSSCDIFSIRCGTKLLSAAGWGVIIRVLLRPFTGSSLVRTSVLL